MNPNILCPLLEFTAWLSYCNFPVAMVMSPGPFFETCSAAGRVKVNRGTACHNDNLSCKLGRHSSTLRKLLPSGRIRFPHCLWAKSPEAKLDSPSRNIVMERFQRLLGGLIILVMAWRGGYLSSTRWLSGNSRGFLAFVMLIDRDHGLCC